MEWESGGRCIEVSGDDDDINDDDDDDINAAQNACVNNRKGREFSEQKERSHSLR